MNTVNLVAETETSFSETKKSPPGYVSVDCKSDDDMDKTKTTDGQCVSPNGNSQGVEEQKAAAIGVIEGEEIAKDEMVTLQDDAPVYFTIHLQKSGDHDDGDNDDEHPNKSNDNYQTPALKNGKVGENGKEIDKTRDHYGVANEQNAGSANNLQYLRTTSLVPDNGVRFSTVVDGRPRAWSERGTVGTGNTYQQLPLTTPNEDDTNNMTYQKLNRGFLNKTPSHPM